MLAQAQYYSLRSLIASYFCTKFQNVSAHVRKSIFQSPEPNSVTLLGYLKLNRNHTHTSRVSLGVAGQSSLR